MRRNLAAFIGAAALALSIPGLASAHSYHGHWHWRASMHARSGECWMERHVSRTASQGTGSAASGGSAVGSSSQTSQGGGQSQGTGSAASGGSAAGSSSQASQSGGQSQGVTTTSTGGKTVDGYQVVQTIDLTATAYGPSAQDNYPYGATDYFGNALVAGDVAVDPRVIPLGTWLWVEGYSFSPYLPSVGFLAHAVDTGGAIKGNRIDLFVNAPDSIVSNFGIQGVTAFVLNKPLAK